MRIDSGRGSLPWRLLAAVGACVVTLTACGSSEEPSAELADDFLCAMEAKSPEHEQLLRIMRADSYTSQVDHRAARFVEGMQINLRGEPEYRVTPSIRACVFFRNNGREAGQTTLTYTWAPPADVEKPGGPAGTRRYRLNGARGTSEDTATSLFVRCDLPGDLEEPSKKMLLRADASFTLNPGAVKDHGTQDQQMSWLYLMTRRTTEALGCANEPLAEDPVVKPLTEGTPS
ncbi:hypothetical protein ACGF1Z_25800 [Streptomyces sp. NPDC048018]|uniref:hypothetical protein n=1 Tax=Streptomyces sp. NPDC048018 TaxID=3365499 RepID=UPI003721EAC8